MNQKKKEKTVIAALIFCLAFAMLFIVFSMLFAQNNPKKDDDIPLPDGTVIPDGSEEPLPPEGSV